MATMRIAALGCLLGCAVLVAGNVGVLSLNIVVHRIPQFLHPDDPRSTGWEHDDTSPLFEHAGKSADGLAVKLAPAVSTVATGEFDEVILDGSIHRAVDGTSHYWTKDPSPQ